MLKVLDKIEDAFVVITIFAATLLVFINVVLRLFGMGTTWSEELIRYLIIWLTFIGASICVRKGEHVGIELLPELLPDRIKKFLALIVNTIVILFLLFLLKYSVELVQFNQKNGQIAPALGIPMYIIYLSVPIGTLLMMIRYVHQVILLFKTGHPITSNQDNQLKG
ncbi:TRAP transporter small permease [Ammoniphilus sp. YIM 78166]|uniref:TRAP transporter small permease n=1 Tax=Ammoniphilus sp. YIM 78166 TaxID=1644106 RepID=UPI0010700B62|nr:TRAP transporter small permease [Ammoniphilus sp. YIM 78166]